MGDQYIGTALHRNFVNVMRDARAVIENPPRSRAPEASANNAASNTAANTPANGTANTTANTNPLAGLEQLAGLSRLFSGMNQAPQVVVIPMMWPWSPGMGNAFAAQARPPMPPLQALLSNLGGGVASNAPMMPLGQYPNPMAGNAFANFFAPPNANQNQQGLGFLFNAMMAYLATLPQPSAQTGTDSALEQPIPVDPDGGNGSTTGNPEFDLLAAQLDTLIANLEQLLADTLKSQVSSPSSGLNAVDSTAQPPASNTPSDADEAALVQSFLFEKLLATGPNQEALFLIAEALQPAEEEGNPDEDDFAVSQPDLEMMKARIENRSVKPKQLIAGFQWLFMNVPAESLDELSVLFAQAVDQQVLKASSLLTPTFLERVEDVPYQALIRGLANSGVNHSDGSMNRDLTGWMLMHLDSENEALNYTAHDLAAAMQDVWSEDRETPEGEKLYTLLETWLVLDPN